jgi:DNA-directed RNA polymerase subunit F
MTPGDSVPTDPDALRALLLAERTHHAEELERLTAIIRELQRHRFGRRAERLDPEQLALALEDVEQTLAAGDAAAAARLASKPRRAGGRSIAARCRRICRAKKPSSM